METYKTAAIRGQQIIIKEVIKPRMEEKGITAYKLAQVTGVSRAIISRWFAGKRTITLITFLKVIGALEINPFFKDKDGI